MILVVGVFPPDRNGQPVLGRHILLLDGHGSDRIIGNLAFINQVTILGFLFQGGLFKELLLEFFSEIVAPSRSGGMTRASSFESFSVCIAFDISKAKFQPSTIALSHPPI